MSLLEERTGGTYYTGPLEPAIAYVKDTYYVSEWDDTNMTGVTGLFRVELYATTQDQVARSASDWGAGRTQEIAWRFALGAEFGPLDEGYDEAALLALLFTYMPKPDRTDPTAVERWLTQP